METMVHKGTALPISDDVDVLVCGGGPAGIAAAVCAARTGAKTLLVERGSCLGGTATLGMMATVTLPYHRSHGFVKEFYEKISHPYREKYAIIPFNIEEYKLAAQQITLESGADLLYYTWVSDVVMEKDQIAGVVVENKSGRSVIRAKMVVDATGDGDIAYHAGVDYVKGREDDHAMRPVTILGFFANVNLKKLKQYVVDHPGDLAQDPKRNLIDLDTGLVHTDGFFSIPERAKELGYIRKDAPINYLRFACYETDDLEHAFVTVNSVRVYGIDGTDARELTKAEIEGRVQLTEIYQACKALLPGFESAKLVASAPFIGVRETRRIKGQYIMTIEDIENRKTYDDSVALITNHDYGRSDVHIPDKGVEGSKDDHWARGLVSGYIDFEVPLRCLLSDQAKNLVVAGRAVSVTHQVDVYTRGMQNVGMVGQAAGTYAALMAKGDFSIGKLQAQLEKDGLWTKVKDQ